MTRDPLLELADRHLIRYVPGFAPFLVERARGSWVWDRDGNRVLDFTSGQICSTIGHNHPRIVEAIRSACDRVLHLNSWMLSEEVVRLAARLAELLPEPLSKAIILNTGSEANEIAMRIAKLATGRFEIAGLDQSFHGLTAGAASVTWSVGRGGYGPQVPGTFMIPAPYAYRCPVKQLANGVPAATRATGPASSGVRAAGRRGLRPAGGHDRRAGPLGGRGDRSAARLPRPARRARPAPAAAC